MGSGKSGESQEETKMEVLEALAGAPGLVAGIVLLAGGAYAWFRIRRQMRMISKAMFGTPSFAEGLERQADILAETPKSVSGMTKLCLPQIEADFPEFHWAQWKQMCENMLKAYLEALSCQDAAVLEGRCPGKPGEQCGSGPVVTARGRDSKMPVSAVSEELKRQVELCIEDQRRRGVRESYGQVRIHQTEISRYQKEAGMCIIKLQSSVEYYYEEIKKEEEAGSWRVNEGRNESGRLGKAERVRQRGKRKSEIRDKIRKEQTRYNMELIYIQDLSKIKELATAVGVTCPNCGAPITRLGSKFCEYCGTGITPVDVRVWKLHRVEKENH